MRDGLNINNKLCNNWQHIPPSLSRFRIPRRRSINITDGKTMVNHNNYDIAISPHSRQKPQEFVRCIIIVHFIQITPTNHENTGQKYFSGWLIDRWTLEKEKPSYYSVCAW